MVPINQFPIITTTITPTTTIILHILGFYKRYTTNNVPN